MKQLEYCPIPMEDGSDCWRKPDPTEFRGVCTEHMQELVSEWVEKPKIAAVKCMNCDEYSVSRIPADRLLMCPTCGVPLVCKAWTPDMAEQLQQSPPQPKQYPRTDVVYYLRFGERVKIGTTTDLPRRMQVIPHDEILAIEPGDVTRERIRHRAFSDLLIPGQREWFHADGRLIAHAAQIRAKAGPPMIAWRRWITRAA